MPWGTSCLWLMQKGQRCYGSWCHSRPPLRLSPYVALKGVACMQELLHGSCWLAADRGHAPLYW